MMLGSSQVNEIVNQHTMASKELDVIFESYLAVEPRSACSCLVPVLASLLSDPIFIMNARSILLGLHYLYEFKCLLTLQTNMWTWSWKLKGYVFAKIHHSGYCFYWYHIESFDSKDKMRNISMGENRTKCREYMAFSKEMVTRTSAGLTSQPCSKYESGKDIGSWMTTSIIRLLNPLIVVNIANLPNHPWEGRISRSRWCPHSLHCSLVQLA